MHFKISDKIEEMGSRARGHDGMNSMLRYFLAFVFFATGTTFILMGLKILPFHPGNDNDYILIYSGIIFGAPGLYLFINTLIIQHRQKTQQNALKLDSKNYWEADRKWNKEFSYSDKKSQGFKGLMWNFFIIIFLIPFHFFGGFIILIFDAVIFTSLGYSIYMIIQGFKYRHHYIKYSEFPFFTGQYLRGQWTSSKGIGDYNKYSITIRCIIEKYVIRETHDSRSQTSEPFQVWEARYDYESRGTHYDNQAISFDLEIPEDLPSTALSDNPPVYWEIEINFDTPGIDFKESYLLPIYCRSGKNSKREIENYYKKIDETSPERFKEKMDDLKKYKKPIIGGIIAFVIFLVGLEAFQYYNYRQNLKANKSKMISQKTKKTQSSQKQSPDEIKKIHNIELNALIKMKHKVFRTVREKYYKGDTVYVYYTKLHNLPYSAITLVKQGTPDNAMGYMYYTRGKISGMQMIGALPSGKYEVRLIENFTNGKFKILRRSQFRVR